MSTVSGARRVQLVPTRPDLVDAAFVVVLGALALLGFRTTFDGGGFFIVGLIGLTLGLLAGQTAVALRQPAVTVLVMAVAAFFLLGGAVALRSDAIGGVIPTFGTWKGLADLSVNGWKQLLTTLPPVDGSGPLLTIPYMLGLLAGAGAQTLARRVSRPWAPVAAMLVLLAAVVLLGTQQPAAELLQGLLFGVVALAWVGIRSARRRPVAGTGNGRTARLVTAVILLAVTAGGAALLGPALPGEGSSRTVLRSYVVPPFDIGQYPSPLVGFRKYTEGAKLAWDHTLFTVKGLPTGQPVRISTLDAYDGTVWGATSGTTPTLPGSPADEFQRVGSHIATDSRGKSVQYTITVAEDYASIPEVRAWIPTAGTVTAVAFGGARSAALDDGFRFDLATDSGVTSALLQSGDTVQLTSLLTDNDVGPGDVAVGRPTLSDAAYGFTSAAVTRLAAQKGDSGIAELLAIGKLMKSTGAYSDGGSGDTSESIYLPGHSRGRLLDFLNRPQFVGTDEHYAATFALMANQLGVPARVVFGAVPETDGTVKGKDVHAWVEVQTGVGRWATIPYDAFTPDRSKKPEAQPPTTVQKANAAVVPPPNVTTPQSSLDQAAQVQANSQRLARKATVVGGGLPGWLVAAFTYAGPPLLFLVLVAAGIVGAKVLRRRRRRRRSRLGDRFASGWMEVLDTVRDLGTPLPIGQTRREQARALGRPAVGSVAGSADRGAFGPDDPTEDTTRAFWVDVDAARADLLAGVSRWRRVRAALSIRSFLPRRAAIA